MMVEAKKLNGEVVVRLGIIGTGQAPNYRLEDGSERPFMAIDGATHRPCPDGEAFDTSENWSSNVMTEDEVKNLIGEIRPFKART